MMLPRQPIGVFDSGVGGLTALTKLAELLPGEDLVYLGDTARVPYGNRSTKTIQYYAAQCVEFLNQHAVKLILVACNTVSSVALDEIERISPVPVIGVIKPAADAVLRNFKQGRVGIIGTRATIQSQAYNQEIYQIDSQKKLTIYGQACPLFVPLIEEGWYEHAVTYNVALEYLLPLKKANIDVLILGCTHYPLLKKVIQSIMPDTQLIDAGEEAALVVSQLLQRHATKKAATDLEPKRSIECYMTDISITALRFAQYLLGVSSEAVHQISIEK